MKKQDKIKMLESELTCVDFVNHLGDFYDQEMDESLALKFSEHQESCEFCKDFYSSYDFAVKSGSLLREKMPEDVKLRLRSNLSEILGIDL